MIKVGVVGIGSMGRNHARIYSELEDVELMGVSDIDENKLKLMKINNVPKTFLDYKDLAEEKPDAVSIAVPTSKHKEVAVYFCEKGIHCLIEKPIASNIEDALKIATASVDNKVKVAIGHIENFNPSVTTLKRIIKSGQLGDILSISAKRFGPFVPRVTDVGIVVDSMTHDIAVVMYLLEQDPKFIFSRIKGIKNLKGDCAVVVLDFENNVTTVLEANWFTPHQVRELSVIGTNGIANLNYMEQTLEIFDKDQKIIPKIEKKEPLRIEIEDFINSIKNDEEPLVDCFEGIQILKVAKEAEKQYYDSIE